MYTFFVTLATALLTLVAPPAPPETPRQHSSLVPASASDIWRLITSGEGWTMLEGGKANVDFRLGGKIDVPSRQDGVSYTILAYEPEHMLAVNTIAPASVPAESRAIGENSCTVFRLEPVTPDRTRLTVTLVGCPEQGKYTGLCDKIRGNGAVIVTRIANHFVSQLVERKEPDRIDAAERLLFRLAGNWSFEQKRPDGSPFSGVSEFKPLFDGKLLVADGFLTVGDRTWHHSHMIAGRDPETHTLRVWSFDEKGDVTEGQIRAEGDDRLVLDWNTHQRADGRCVDYRVEYIFNGADEFRCVVLDAPEADGSRKEIADVTYRRAPAGAK